MINMNNRGDKSMDNKRSRIFYGFSMVEMMLLLVIVSLMLASGVAVISKKHVKVPHLAVHGAYMCYVKNGNLHEEKYLGTGLSNKILDQDTAKCVFTPPARASYFHIQATGGGGGGGAAGYEGGNILTYQSATEVITPFGIKKALLDLKGISENELKTNGGKLWAYANGTGKLGDGGKGGDLYYIHQECSNDCLYYRKWKYNGTDEKECEAHYSNATITEITRKYSYLSSVPCSGTSCDHCTTPDPLDPTKCISGYNDVTNYVTCTDEYGIPDPATCSAVTEDKSVQCENIKAKNLAPDAPYRVELSPATLSVGNDLKERIVKRDKEVNHTICNYGNTSLYSSGTSTEDGIFGSFSTADSTGVDCNTKALREAFGEQMYKISDSETSMQETVDMGACEAYYEALGGVCTKDYKFPYYLLTEDNGGLGAFGESYKNVYNDSIGGNVTGDTSCTYTNPVTGITVDDSTQVLQTGCTITSYSTHDNLGCASYDHSSSYTYVGVVSHNTRTQSVITSYSCPYKSTPSSDEKCLYSYADIATIDPDDEIHCAYIPQVVAGGANGVGKFCALNDVQAGLEINYTGISTIIPGVNGSDLKLFTQEYAPLYTKSDWVHTIDYSGTAEGGAPSQGFAEIKLGGNSCKIHADVPGAGAGAEKDPGENVTPGAAAPAGGPGQLVGSIDGSGYTQDMSRDCGHNEHHVGYCLKDRHNNVRENGKYTYQYTWQTNYLQYGEGGKAGEYRVKIIRAFNDKNIEITLGRGGAGGTGATDCDGKDGTDTIVGDILTAKGGKGGKGCIPTAAEQMPYWYSGGTFKATQPGGSGELATVTNYKTNIINLVLPVDKTTLGDWVASSGAGGNGGGSTNDCWASEWVRHFEGKQMEELGGKLDTAQLANCRNQSYSTGDPPKMGPGSYTSEAGEDGLNGVVLIKW